MRRLLAQNGSSGGAPPVQSRVLRGVGSPERRCYLDRLAEKDREGGSHRPLVWVVMSNRDDPDYFSIFFRKKQEGFYPLLIIFYLYRDE